MKLVCADKDGHNITAEMPSGMLITMNRQLMVIQLEAFGYLPKEAFELVCRVEDAWPLALKVRTK